MTGEQVIFAVYLFVSALLFGLGVPLWREKVPPNWWYGFRTPTTLGDERIWYPVNRVTGWWMIAIGVVTVPVALATYLTGMTANEAALYNMGSMLIGTVGMMVHGFALLGRLKRELPIQRR